MGDSVFSINKAARVLAPAFALLLGACGGGGGGGSAAVAPMVGAMVITAGNAPTVVAAAISSSGSAADLGPGAGGPAVGVVVESGETRKIRIARLVPRVMRAAQVRGDGGLVAMGAVFAETCTGGGTVTAQKTSGATGVVQPGDRMTVTFSNCTFTDIDNFTITLNGGFGYVLTDGLGSLTMPAAWNAVGTFTFTQLSVAEAGAGAFSINGSVTLSLDTTNGGQDYTGTMKGGPLTLTDGVDTLVLSQMDLWFSDNLVSGALATGASTDLQYPAAGSLRISDSTVGTGYFDVHVQTNLSYPGGVPGYPTAGRIHVLGANNSAVLLEILPAGAGVSISTDADGNGSYESVVSQSWADFGPLLD